MTTQFYYNFNLINIILYYNHYIDLLHLSCNIIFEGEFNLLGRGGGGGLMTTHINYNFKVFNVILYYNHYIDLLHLSCNIIFEGEFNLLGRGGGGGGA